MKSHAVREDGAGMPGVSGDEYVSGPPTSGARAKLPGVVPCPPVEGSSAPCKGSAKRLSADGLIKSVSCLELVPARGSDAKRLSHKHPNLLGRPWVTKACGAARLVHACAVE